MSKAASFAFGLVLMPVFSASAAPSSKLGVKGAMVLPGLEVSPKKLMLRADRLSASRAPGCAKAEACATRITLRGRVVVRGDGLRIDAASMSILVAKSGRVATLGATGKARFSLGKRKGSATQIDYSVARGAMALRGDARLELPGLGLVLGGERIELDLKKGRVTVSRARAEVEVRPR